MNTDFDADAALPSQIPIFPLPNALLPVSYTHLTLPTRLLV